MEENKHEDRKSGSSYWRHSYYPHYWWKRRYYPYHGYYYNNYPDDYYSWRRRYGSHDVVANGGGYANKSKPEPANMNFMEILQELFSLKIDAMTMIRVLQHVRDKQISDDKIFEMVESMLEKYHSSGEMLDFDDVGMLEKEAEVRAKQENDQHYPFPGPMPEPEPTPSPEPIVPSPMPANGS